MQESFLADENIFKPYRASPLRQIKSISSHAPVYNANVRTKKEFLCPDEGEREFGELERQEENKQNKERVEAEGEYQQSREKEKPKRSVCSGIAHELKTLYALKTKKSDSVTNRWEYLYEMSKVQKESLDQIRQERAKIKENDPNLTFKPKISSKFQMSSGFLTRIEAWDREKKDKLQTKRENERDKDLENCTFKPMLTENFNSKIINYENNENKLVIEGKGVEQFLRRQILARQAREEKEMLLSNLFFSQKKDAQKIPNITIPNEFNFGSNTLRCPNMKTEFQKAFSPARTVQQAKLVFQNNEPNLASRIKEVYHNPDDYQINKEKITFGEAIRKLHGELHTIKINID